MRFSVPLATIALTLLGGSAAASGAGLVGTPVERTETLSVVGCDLPDVNGDGAATVADIVIVVMHFGQTVPPAPASADLNGDGAISVADIVEMVSWFGRYCPY